jgi:hypothetical protein
MSVQLIDSLLIARLRRALGLTEDYILKYQGPFYLNDARYIQKLIKDFGATFPLDYDYETPEDAV